MQRSWINKISVIFAIVCAAALTGCGTNTIKETDVVMQINQQEVVKAEYLMILDKHEAEVKRQYTTDQANQKNFWSQEYNGEKPISQLMGLTQSELVHYKIIAELAKEYGISDATDYETIITNCRTENESRLGDDKEIVYGLLSFEEADYYAYVYQDIEARLLEMIKKEASITEAELEASYNEQDSEQSFEEMRGILESELRTAYAQNVIKAKEAEANVVYDEKQLQKIVLSLHK